MTLGQFGEDAAVSELKRRGYAILDTNFRTVQGEIDIVAEDGEEIVFVEVKTRRSQYFGPPRLAVGAAKRHKIRRMAHIWLSRRRPSADLSFRFDVISLVVDERGNVSHLEVLPHAF